MISKFSSKVFFHKVCEEFQGEDEYRETLLLWVRPSQVGSTLDVGHGFGFGFGLMN